MALWLVSMNWPRSAVNAQGPAPGGIPDAY
jgi:hypothetical protein